MKSSKNTHVKKTLVRIHDSKVKEPHQVVHETESQTSTPINLCSQKEIDNQLLAPSLCSSEIFFNYLNDVRKTSPPQNSIEDMKLNKPNVNYKVTKKLNFHFDDRIYNNLIELNTNNINNTKNKKEKQSTSTSTRFKKDLEPNIEDFYHETAEKDTLPTIPIIKPKFRPVRPKHDQYLHKLIESFENMP